jgi:hypothetical protein
MPTTLPRRGRHIIGPPPAEVVGAGIAVMAGMLLLAAAVAKAATWAQAGQATVGAWRLPATLAITALIVEGGTGLLLLLAPWHARIRTVGASAFLLLAGLATVMAIGGAESCGCFGRVAVPPWATALLDGGLAAALLGAPASPRTGGPARARLALLAALVGAGGVGLAVPATSPPATGTAGDAAALVEALPRACRGGRWVVCCYRSTCAHCRDALPGWLRQARVADLAERGPRWAFVVVDDRPPGSDPWPAEAPFPHAWRAAPGWSTPSFLLLADGAVRAVSNAPPAIR